MAPEQFKDGKLKYTTKTDIWSYGVTLWELIERKVPFEGVEGHLVIANILKGDYLTIKDKDCPEILRSILKDIFVEDPNERPSFTEIVARIEESLQSRGLDAEKKKANSSKLMTKSSSESQTAYERPPFDPSIEDSHAYINHTELGNKKETLSIYARSSKEEKDCDIRKSDSDVRKSDSGNSSEDNSSQS